MEMLLMVKKFSEFLMEHTRTLIGYIRRGIQMMLLSLTEPIEYEEIEEL